MAKGITELDVHGAADTLVAQGERPTVERIRAHLGTGSPNTVTRWLETWWQALGTRLQARATAEEMPGIPEAVAQLAEQLWKQAIGQAQNLADAATAGDRAEILQERDALADERVRIEAAMQAANAATTEARRGEEESLARLADSQLLIEQLRIQVADATFQRNEAQRRLGRLEEEQLALRHEQKEIEEKASAEREAQRVHLRGVEDRAHQEIDRARQETQKAKTELSAQVRRLEVDLQQANVLLQEARQLLGKSQAEAQAQRARADALALVHTTPRAARTRAKGGPSPTQPTPKVRKSAPKRRSG